MTSKLTREFMQNIISGHGFGVAPSAVKAMAEYIVAAMDSKPVAWTEKCEITNMQATGLYLRGFPDNSHGRDIPLYRHAQQPVVPEEMNFSAACNFVQINGMAKEDRVTLAMRVWNACRAAMLQAGNSPVIGIDPASGPDRSVEVRYSAPPGYVMVPKEPTERMVIDGFESEPDETFSESEVWEAYQKMSGCEQAAYRARLCWDAMLAAAPQEVK
ncbi:TPA: hypothetical protein ACXGKJ_004963 [Klebsiella oxytoca]